MLSYSNTIVFDRSLSLSPAPLFLGASKLGVGRMNSVLTVALASPDPLTFSKSQNAVGYAPTHDIYQGMEEAIEWYIESISKDFK